ncbi:MAG: biliverdin-producing heme oxygenase [Armatimonas sp.]
MLTDTLRSGTRTHHDRIEQKLGLPHRVTSQEEYVELLTGFYGFYRSVEPKLQEWLSGLPDFCMAERQKWNLLRLDLTVLGFNEGTIAAIPLCSTPPAVDTVPQALGCLYVLEGSTLGGQVISAHFRRALGITPENGGRYFHGYGSQTAECWRSFKEALLIYSQRYPENDLGILESARATFESLEAWLCRDSRA